MSWRITRSGQKVDLFDPDPATIRVEDIAHHLSQINRYSGATERPWSVAAHSLLCVRLAHGLHVTPYQALWTLLHDAHEAYTGDTIRPMKDAIGRARFETVERKLDVAIRKALGVQHLHTSDAERIARQVDEAAQAVECSIFFPEVEDWPKQNLPEEFVEEVHELWSRSSDELREFFTGAYMGILEGALSHESTGVML